MYDVDEFDKLVELSNLPRPDIGAPLQHLVSDEAQLVLAYLVSVPDPAWDGSYAKLVDPDSNGQLVALIRFRRLYAHMFGPPNDEAFDGHPLALRGLCPYAAFEVQQSSWLRRLERMNAIHWNHDQERFLSRKRHFVFGFHDSTFECIAENFDFAVVPGSIRSVMPRMFEFLKERS